MRSADLAPKAWDLGNSALLFQVQAHSGAIRSLAIDESGTYLASVGEDGSVRVASAHTGDAFAEWNARRDVACCAVTSDLSVHEAGYRSHAGTRTGKTGSEGGFTRDATRRRMTRHSPA
jgi:WD40 repeat protein